MKIDLLIHEIDNAKRGEVVKYKREQWVVTGWSVEKRRVWLGRDGATVTLTNKQMLAECGLSWSDDD